MVLFVSLGLSGLGCPGDDGGSTGADTGPGPTGGATTAPATTEATTATPTTSAMDETGDPAPPAAFCTHQCTSPDDCTISGTDFGYTCDDGMCNGWQCTTDDGCIAEASGWTVPCTSGGGECDAAMQICIDFDGQGLCALPAAVVDCGPSGLQQIEVTDIDGATVEVCGRLAECGDDGSCFSRCSPGSCLQAGFPSCNMDTGRCECTGDSDCASIGIDHLAVCIDGACGCSEDIQCASSDLGDTCFAGTCGCSGDDACGDVDQQYDGGAVACVMQ